MPRVLRARRPVDVAEERWLRKLARSKRVPAEQVLRARTVVLSWDGADTATIAAGLGCHPQTVRQRIARFNAEGAQSIAAMSTTGRRPRLTESQRQELVALALRLVGGQATPVDLAAASPHDHETIRPGGPSKVSLDVLVAAAQAQGIEIRRSQLRRVLLAAGLRWDPIRSWGSLHTLAHTPARTGQSVQD